MSSASNRPPDSIAEKAFEAVLQTALVNCEAVVHLAISQPSSAVPRYARLGITTAIGHQFGATFDEFLREQAKLWKRKDLRLIPYNAARKQEEDTVEWLFLPEYKAIEAQVSPLETDQAEYISPRDIRSREFGAGLRFYAATARPWLPTDTHLVFFRSYNVSKVLGVSLFGAFWDGEQQYDQINKTAFLFDKGVDCVQAGHYLFIFQKYNFHTIFRFEELIREVAKDTLERIRVRVPIINFEDFVRDCQRPLSKLLKIRNIGQQEYLEEITLGDLERVISLQGSPITIETGDDGKRRLRYNSGDTWALLKLLDDDRLISPMTNRMYDAHSKSPVPVQRAP